eukprot:COSAG01_NODE_25841_length_731_cov_1.618671_2_plen_126_part_01
MPGEFSNKGHGQLVTAITRYESPLHHVPSWRRTNVTFRSSCERSQNGNAAAVARGRGTASNACQPFRTAAAQAAGGARGAGNGGCTLTKCQGDEQFTIVRELVVSSFAHCLVGHLRDRGSFEAAHQ